jgi:hypothetical protein
MKNRFTISVFIIAISLSVSCKKEKATLPVLTTAGISEISYTIATSGGNITSDGGAAIISKGVCWSTSAKPTIDGNKTIETGSGSFISKITGLTQNTHYYLRAYATNSVGTSYGNELSFTTIPVSAPSLTTAEVTSVSYRIATSGGTISSDNGEVVTLRGVCWNTTSNPTIADSKTNDGTGTGSFVSSITGLSPNTTYYTRAYAINSVGTSYGFQKSFTTIQTSIPTITTEAVTTITKKSAVSGGNITSDNGEPVSSRGICWSINENPTIVDSKTTEVTGTGNFTSNLTGLTPNTTYFIRSYAINSVGLAYGNQITFKTDPVDSNLNNGLIAYYPFNGSAADRSGNNNNGTVNGAVLTSDKFGHPKSAFLFNGPFNYISLQPASNFVGLNNYTVSLWVKPTVYSTNGGGIIFGFGSNSYGPLQALTYQPNSTIFAGSYNIGSNPTESYSKSCCYNPGNWFYVVVTRDNSNISLYINGILIVPAATSATNGQDADYGPGAYSAILGGRSSLDYQYFFTGIIDEVRIYNRVLSGAEISDLKGLNE